jgi:hypothetical protein
LITPLQLSKITLYNPPPTGTPGRFKTDKKPRSTDPNELVVPNININLATLNPN